MKKVFAVCLCLIPLFALSQRFKPANLLTLVKFGSNKKTTVETIKAIGGGAGDRDRDGLLHDTLPTKRA